MKNFSEHCSVFKHRHLSDEKLVVQVESCNESINYHFYNPKKVKVLFVVSICELQFENFKNKMIKIQLKQIEMQLQSFKTIYSFLMFD